MNVVHSSGWLEYFANGKNANFFAKPIENVRDLIIPSITLCEVYKRLIRQRDEPVALQAIAAMQQGTVIDLDSTLAIASAQLGVTHRLPLADSIILATARAHDATLWTQDADFEGLPNVKYVALGKRRQ